VVNRDHSHNDVVIVKEDPHVKAWEDARYGIQNMTIEHGPSDLGVEVMPGTGRLSLANT
jgi:hypothetical protein